MGTRTRLSVTFYVHCLSCSPSHQMNSGFCCESIESNTRLRDRQPRILGSTPSKGTVFSLFQSVQTVCGAHSASCSVGQEYFTPRQPGEGGGGARGVKVTTRGLLMSRCGYFVLLDMDFEIPYLKKIFFFTNDAIVLF